MWLSLSKGDAPSASAIGHFRYGYSRLDAYVRVITRASWGEEVSSPRVGRYIPRVRGIRPRHPHSTLCIFMFVVSLSLLNFSESYNFGAHPLAMDAHSGNAQGGIHACP